MKTKVFNFTDDMFRTYQAIANVDVGGKVYVHYISAFDFNIDADGIDMATLNTLYKMVNKWANKHNYLMWAY
jgi:hypothetical protein